MRQNTKAVPEGTTNAAENLCLRGGNIGEVIAQKCPEYEANGKVLMTVGSVG
jgi:hypothetical protein